MRRGTFFVFMLMLYGISTAVADILKLTGASGVAMSAFTTTLLIYDFIVSLMLVVVVFYAYFLECGAGVPVIKEKPLMIFGFFRLGYYLLLAYYLCYRALYCAVNHDTVSIFQFIFYLVYLCLIILLVLANCHIFNIITRNLIRRSYEKSFHHLAIAGFVVQALLPIAYILARIFMDDVGDEYFTTAICDLIRLFIAPMMLTSVWFLFLHAVGQVHEVYSEVDTALKSKRYQITYSAESNGKKSRRKGHTAPPAQTATLLPAGAASAEAIAGNVPRALNAAAVQQSEASVAAPVAETTDESKAETDLNNIAETADVSTSAAEDESSTLTSEESTTADTSESKTDNTEPDEDEIITTFATEARKAVAKTAAQTKAQKKQHNASQGKNNKAHQNNKNAQNRTHSAQAPQNVLPVQEFDPYPAVSVPYRSQKQNAQNRQNQNNRTNVRPNNAQNPRQPQSGKNQPQRSGNAANTKRPNQQRPQNGQQHHNHKNGQHTSNNNKRPNNH